MPRIIIHPIAPINVFVYTQFIKPVTNHGYILQTQRTIVLYAVQKFHILGRDFMSSMLQETDMCYKLF